MVYKGRLKIEGESGDGIPVDLIIDDVFVDLAAGEEHLGRWRMDLIEIARLAGNEFSMVLDGERMVFQASDPLGFAYNAVTTIEEISARLRKKRSLFRRRPEAPRRSETSRPAVEPEPRPTPSVTDLGDLLPPASSPSLDLPAAPEPVQSANPEVAVSEDVESEPAVSYLEDDLVLSVEDPQPSDGVEAAAWDPGAPKDRGGPGFRPGLTMEPVEIPQADGPPEPLDSVPVESVGLEPLEASAEPVESPEDFGVSEESPEGSVAEVSAVSESEALESEPLEASAEPVESPEDFGVSEESPEASVSELSVEAVEWAGAVESPEDSGVSEEPPEVSASEEPLEPLEVSEEASPAVSESEPSEPSVSEVFGAAELGSGDSPQVAAAPGQGLNGGSAGEPEFDSSDLRKPPGDDPVGPAGESGTLSRAPVAPAPSVAVPEPPVRRESVSRERGRRRRFGRRSEEVHEHEYSESRTVGGITRRVCIHCGHVSFASQDVYEEW